VLAPSWSRFKLSRMLTSFAEYVIYNSHALPNVEELPLSSLHLYTALRHCKTNLSLGFSVEMLGAFRASSVNFGGLLWCVVGLPGPEIDLGNSRARKTPWKLSRTRKANVRARLKKVDAVIEAVRTSGVQCKSLVRAFCCVL
jgi:hypothetical protein